MKIHEGIGMYPSDYRIEGTLLQRRLKKEGELHPENYRIEGTPETIKALSDKYLGSVGMIGDMCIGYFTPPETEIVRGFPGIWGIRQLTEHENCSIWNVFPVHV